MNKLQRQLQDSKNTLQAVIKTAVDGIIIINSRGIINMVNQAAIKLFGYSEEEMLGQNVSLLMPSPHREDHDAYIDNYHKTGKGKIIGIGREVDGKRKDGTLFPLRLAVSKVEADDGLLFVGVIHDLTEEKAAEEKIISLNKELEQKVEERTEKLTDVVNKLLQSNIKLEQEVKEKEAAEAALLKNEQELKTALEKEKELNELKSRFVSMASHEFRTPLTTIASSAELIGMYAHTDQQKKREKHLKRIQSAVTNLTGILGDFLSLSKLEEGKIMLHPVQFNMEELLIEAVEEMQSILKPNQIICKNFHNTNGYITLDKKLVKNIFLNLLSNAIKYSDAGSSIWLDVKIEDKVIHASLKDEGIGIPVEDQKHLFSRFFRAENAINIQGTGLGLNIVKRYLDMLGGKIWFESSQGNGTSFFFEIPVD
ncbi:MAG: PAS domain-containing sensor histidine kinase [Chitinophagales bacterium]|nr:PAS domain-containing sensor histidine kinase [Chitinophagales bacterium]